MVARCSEPRCAGMLGMGNPQVYNEVCSHILVELLSLSIQQVHSYSPAKSNKGNRHTIQSKNKHRHTRHYEDLCLLPREHASAIILCLIRTH